MSEWHGILALMEYHNRRIELVGFQLLGTAQRLSAETRCPVQAVIIGHDTVDAEQQLLEYEIDHLVLCEMPDSCFRADDYSAVLCECIGELHPAVVLIGGTAQGRAIAPRAAVQFRTGLTADCTELFMHPDGMLEQVRPAFGGNLMARILTPEARPQFATVRPNIMPAAETSQTCIRKVTRKGFPVLKSPIQVLNTIPVQTQDGIGSAKVLVAAGKGVRCKEDLGMLGALAEALGGTLACTRAVVELGWLPPERQIGLSGQTVAPHLLLACGVSGSVQFTAGMRRSRHIIAVNSDPDAPIFSIAHQGYCCDLYELVPSLLKIIKPHHLP